MESIAPEAIFSELRLSINTAFVVPPNVEAIPERVYATPEDGKYEEKPLREYRLVPNVTGAYADIAAEALRRNQIFQPYGEKQNGDTLVSYLYYPHPITKEVHNGRED